MSFWKKKLVVLLG